MYFKIVVLFSLLVLISCTKPERDPEAALKSYINDWFSGSLSKEEMLKRTTGTLFHRISAMDEKQITEFGPKEKFQKNSLVINLKTCTEKSCHITYTLIYDQKSQEYKSNIEVKKIAELVWVDDAWKIADVSNFKTFLEFKDEISP